MSNTDFDVNKYVALVPPFREAEVDSYFGAFERLAIALKWPEEKWALLLQCKIQGKAQDVVAALPLADSLKYGVVKEAILRAYELVPEAYRQKFRSHKKAPSQTFVEYAREKGSLFDRWCSACRVSIFTELRELVLLEEFKRRLPDCLVIHLNEQKVTSLSVAAVMADEFVLTHKVAYSFTAPDRPRSPPQSSNVTRTIPSSLKEERECFYCHQSGHIIANCLKLKQKGSSQAESHRRQQKGMGVTKVVSAGVSSTFCSPTPDSCFEPFTFNGKVSLPEAPHNVRSVRILRDTGGSQSVILANVLPFSEKSACGYNVFLNGIEFGCVPRPLHRVRLQSELVSGVFPVAVCPALPISGIVMLLGNDIAGGRVIPALEDLDSAPCIPDRPEEMGVPVDSPSCAMRLVRPSLQTY